MYYLERRHKTMTDTERRNKAVGWSDQLDELTLELRGITEILGDLAYDMEDTKPAYSTIARAIFTACNHIDRIAQDMLRLDDELTELRHRNTQPQKLTETVTTTKTMFI